jgi:UDP-N-acetylmuramoyl-tripeptide--D-alanyl-D-alanine ligase
VTAAGLEIDPQEAADRLFDVVLPPMRMEIRDQNGATVLLDTYNASPPSMISAIETVSDMPVDGRRVAVLGEMRELGEFAEEAHRRVGRAIRASKIEEVLLVGEPMRFAALEVGAVPVRSGTVADARQFLSSLRPGDVALVKGSRALELESALSPPAPSIKDGE